MLGYSGESSKVMATLFVKHHCTSHDAVSQHWTLVLGHVCLHGMASTQLIQSLPDLSEQLHSASTHTHTPNQPDKSKVNRKKE